nr:hypothetical protein [Micromonospora sp. DSM 115978]
MHFDKRDRREQTGAERSGGQRTPRSGGRSAAERTNRTVPTVGRGSARAGGRARARGAREFPTDGSAALRPREQVDAERPLRVWDSSAETAPAVERAGRPNRAASPRLRVAPPPPVSVPGAPFVALILVLVVGGVLGILVVNTKINENSFRLGKLREQQATLDVQEQQLQTKITEAETPNNLAAQARKLGLVESGPPAFIRLPDGQVIGVPQPAGGQPAITSQQGAGG